MPGDARQVGVFKVGCIMLPGEIGGCSCKKQLTTVDDRHAAAHFFDVMQRMGLS